MPNQAVQFFSDDPTQQANYLQLQQRAALAQALMAEGMKPLETQGRQVGGIGYRISPLEGLAKMLQAYTGQKMGMDTAQQQGQLQADYFKNIRAQMAGSQPPPPQDQPPPQLPPLAPSAMALAQGAQQGSVGPTNDNAARMAMMLRGQQAPVQPPPGPMPQGAPGMPPGAPQGQMPNPGMPMPTQGMPPGPQGAPMPPQGAPQGSALNPMGWNPEFATRFFLQDPTEYMKTAIAQQSPTDLQKLLLAQGLRPGTPQYQAALQANIEKQNYIPPTAIRPGGAIKDARTGALTTLPSQAPNGYQNVQQADGTWAVAPVQGGTDAIRQSAQAESLGKSGGQLVDSVDPTTGAGTKVPGAAFLPASAGAGAPQQPGRFGGYTPPTPAQKPMTSLPPGSGDLANAGAKRYNDLITQAQDSPMRVNVIDSILHLSQGGVDSGPTADWKNKMLGMAASIPGAEKVLPQTIANAKDDIAKFQELSKFMSQNALRNWQSAGGTGTDAQLEATVSANINKGLFPQAVQAIAQWQKASELALQAKAKAAQEWRSQGGTPLQQDQFETTWRKNFDPRVYQIALMPQGARQAYVDQQKDAAQLKAKIGFALQNGFVQ